MRVTNQTSDIADRIEITYTCPQNHTFSVTFAADITVPESWDCPRCGKNGTTVGAPAPEEDDDDQRTHWDMVLERRSPDELADMLAQRVAQMRATSAH